MDMAGDPVLQLHIVTDFRIGKAAAGQDSHEQVRLADLTGDRIMDIQSCTGPVHLHGIAGLVLDTHGCLGDAGPFTVFLAELRKHVRLLAFIVAFTAVLLPQQGQGNAVLCQLTVNVRIVRFNVQANTLVLVREEHPLHRHW